MVSAGHVCVEKAGGSVRLQGAAVVSCAWCPGLAACRETGTDSIWGPCHRCLVEVTGGDTLALSRNTGDKANGCDDERGSSLLQHCGSSLQLTLDLRATLPSFQIPPHLPAMTIVQA